MMMRRPFQERIDIRRIHVRGSHVRDDRHAREPGTQDFGRLPGRVVGEVHQVDSLASQHGRERDDGCPVPPRPFAGVLPPVDHGRALAPEDVRAGSRSRQHRDHPEAPAIPEPQNLLDGVEGATKGVRLVIDAEDGNGGHPASLSVVVVSPDAKREPLCISAIFAARRGSRARRSRRIADSQRKNQNLQLSYKLMQFVLSGPGGCNRELRL